MKRLAFVAASSLVVASVVALVLHHTLALQALGEASAESVEHPPHIRPDFADIVIPPNIAPLNFRVEEPGEAYLVRLASARGDAIELTSDSPDVRIPIEQWRRLLKENAGEALSIDISVRQEGGGWRRFAPITNTIAAEPIDGYLTYRLMKPWYTKFGSMAIFQRNLASFEERRLIDTEVLGHGCVNCHAFVWNQPETMTLHVRFPFVMLLARDGKISPIETRTEFNKGPFAYPSWHPNGRMAAYSVNKILQVFHTFGETRDVVDFASDIVLYIADTNTVTTTPALSDPYYLETFPAWAPDGKTLYFCSSPATPTDDFKRFREARYDLMRVSFDPETLTWGERETVLRAGDVGLSMATPRVSPDGRYILLCVSDYGTFPIFFPGSDLRLLDIETGVLHDMACNSDKTESWHGWSVDSRWIVFTSKRYDGLLARPYFSYIDDEGNASKAFVMPQEDPSFYDDFVKTYSVPELTVGPVDFDMRDLAGKIQDAGLVTAANLDPAVQARQAAEPHPDKPLWSEAPPRDGAPPADSEPYDGTSPVS